MADSEIRKNRSREPGHRSFRSFKSRLRLWFGLLFVVAIALLQAALIWGIPGSPIDGFAASHRHSTFGHLQAIGDLIETRLLRVLEERRDDIEVMAGNDLVAFRTTELRDAWQGAQQAQLPELQLRDHLIQQTSHRLLTNYLTRIQRTFGIYRSIFIADIATGTILASTQNDDLLASAMTEASFPAGIRVLGTCVLDVAVCPRSNNAVLHITHPVFRIDGTTSGTRQDPPVAILIAELDPEDLFADVLQTRDLLGATGEALLVNGTRRIITSLKHPLPDGSRPHPLEYTNSGTPAQLAAARKRGLIEATDYRGATVLASYRFVQMDAEWGWGLVVKQDKNEAYAPLYRGVVISAGTSLAVVACVLLLTGILSRQLTQPLGDLSRAAASVSAGDLAVRVPVGHSGELGLLAEAFNDMVSRVRQWHIELENEVAARTASLRTEMAERLRAEEDKRDSEERFHSLFAAMAEGVALHEMVLDNSGRPVNYVIIDVNPRYEAIVGLQRQDVVGRPATEVYQTSEPPYLAEFTTAIDARQAFNFETYFAPMDKHFHISVAPLDRSRFATIFFDVTLQKKAEAELTELTRTLAAKNDELQSIVYVASHDLRSPLVNIQGFSKELSFSCKAMRDMVEPQLLPPDIAGPLTDILSTEIPQSLDFIQAGAARIDALLRGLLCLSRLGRAALEIETLEMNELLTEAVKSLSFQIQEANAHVQIEPLPSCRGDATQISQVFTNLIDNAIKYHDKSRPAVVRITGVREQDRSVYCVEDNGIGIAQEHQGKVFEVFHRLSPSGVGGEGLGLTIARRILDRHNGSIWVESLQGQGSRFFVALPCNEQMTRSTGHAG